jgi:Zn-dependent peptidase ImmA (M78 family)
VNPEGLRIARLFRQTRDLREERRCDLEAILEEDGIDLRTSRDADPGYTAMLLDSSLGSAIFLQPHMHVGRRRFSIAHELGHFHIPGHRGKGRRCSDRDLSVGGAGSREKEWEANTFAAELLMPAVLFSRDCARVQIDFNGVEHLATEDYYAVSLFAAALRVVQVTTEPCALVASTDTVIDWVARSKNMPWGVRGRGQKVRGDTAAAEPEDCRKAEDVDALAWYDEWPSEATVLESTLRVGATGQVLSLLWIPDLE